MKDSTIQLFFAGPSTFYNSTRAKGPFLKGLLFKIKDRLALETSMSFMWPTDPGIKNYGDIKTRNTNANLENKEHRFIILAFYDL